MSIQERNQGIKRQRTSEAQVGVQTTTVDSAVVEFKLQIKNVARGKFVHSDPISAGGHMWKINCFSRRTESSDAYLAIFLELLSKSGNVKAIFEAFLMGMDGEPSSLVTLLRKRQEMDLSDSDKFGWSEFIRVMDLSDVYCERTGEITFICSIMVLHHSGIPVPPSDIGQNLGMLLDSTDGADVSFAIDGETFHAHRAVLAARSPVFRAELLGSMAEATMPSITLLDIAPETFRVLLRFMYTDAFPGDDELGDSSSKMLQNLLAAADRYGLDRLKLICAHKLWDTVSVDNVADVLACAEMYSCLELKDKCIDFVVADKNFKRAVLTGGFMEPGQNFPSIIAEVRARVGT